jgi:ATP-binding cassette, subfamily B, bacterial MsbA
MSRFWRQFSFLLHRWSLLLLACTAGLISSLLEGMSITLVFPLLQDTAELERAEIPEFIKGFLSLFEGRDLTSRLQFVALLLVLIIGTKGFMLYTAAMCAQRLQIAISKHFQMRCIGQAMEMSLGSFNKFKGGHLHAIIYGHASNMGVSFSRFVTSIHLPFTVVVLLAFLFSLSFYMTLVSLFISCVLLVALRLISGRVDKASRDLTPALNQVSSAVLEALAGMKVIRIFNREEYAKGKLEDVVDHRNKVVLRLGQLKNTVGPLTTFLGSAGVAVILVSCSLLLVGDRGFAVESLLVFLVAFNRLIVPINEINLLRTTFIGDLPYYREVFDFLDGGENEQQKSGTVEFAGLKQGIVLEDVGFQYDNAEGRVLQNVSFVLKKGTKLGVVGTSGAGKSTLTDLLLRFFDPQSGRVLVDGINLREFELGSWREKIGVVSQDVFLFNDTIRNNIVFANPEADEDAVLDAAKRAYAHEFIDKLANGYETIVGDRGVRLSGGQKQRIAVARAILANPEILIFDEATSALDSESEKILQRALDEVGQGKTVITIAHRLSTIIASDQIIVMVDGGICEQGTHGELLEKGQVYSKLVADQGLAPSSGELAATDV